MDQERTRLKSGHPNKCYPMDEVIRLLRDKDFDPEKSFYEAKVSGINPDHIRSLLPFPYEVALTKRGRIVTLSTGTRHYTPKEQKFSDRVYRSETFLHTHPVLEGEVPVTTPSFSDIYPTTCFEGKKLAVAHANGITIYRAPIIDPRTRKACRREARDIITIYGEVKHVDIFGTGSNRRKFHKMSPEEQIDFQKQFAKDTGVTVEEVLWENEKEVNRVVYNLFNR